ncbi:MAG: AAA family ATPase [Terriglobales bacterium]|jgi:predicted ATPase
MLTRLRVSGFKNLVDVDVHFGPFTCIAGANGVGKSNLFDAIAFLSALAEKPLIDAALSVRDEGGRSGDVRSLFHRVGGTYTDEMSFDVEMVVPKTGYDDLGQTAKATATFLHYELVLRYRPYEGQRAVGGLEIIKEELRHIKRGDAGKHLPFGPSSAWKKSVITGVRGTPFISTHPDSGSAIIKIHQDGKAGRARMLPATNLPRTALSATSAAETKTATLARREMQSWKLLQLEPSSLRAPDSFTAPTKLGSDGSHLAATLYRMGRAGDTSEKKVATNSQDNPMYAKVANRLSELLEDVRGLSISRDENREQLTLFLEGRDGTAHPARALSDGTLRFLALAVLELDFEAQGVLCLEEPENGIHPKRIPAILNLLRDIAVDTDYAVGVDNPLRQVIVNTHSPSVVAQVSDDSLLIAESRELVSEGRPFKALSFACLPNTWRARIDKADIVRRGRILEYLSPIAASDSWRYQADSSARIHKRVIDRDDMQEKLFQ